MYLNIYMYGEIIASSPSSQIKVVFCKFLKTLIGFIRNNSQATQLLEFIALYKQNLIENWFTFTFDQFENYIQM